MAINVFCYCQTVCCFLYVYYVVMVADFGHFARFVALSPVLLFYRCLALVTVRQNGRDVQNQPPQVVGNNNNVACTRSCIRLGHACNIRRVCARMITWLSHDAILMLLFTYLYYK